MELRVAQRIDTDVLVIGSGAHYRSDYPDEDDGQWLKTIGISHRSGEMVLQAMPV